MYGLHLILIRGFELLLFFPLKIQAPKNGEMLKQFRQKYLLYWSSIASNLCCVFRPAFYTTNHIKLSKICHGRSFFKQNLLEGQFLNCVLQGGEEGDFHMGICDMCTWRNKSWKVLTKLNDWIYLPKFIQVFWYCTWAPTLFNSYTTHTHTALSNTWPLG